MKYNVSHNRVMVELILGNLDCRVSNLSAIRRVLGKIKGGKATFFSMSKSVRRKFLTQIISIHKANRKLYNQVSSGYFH